MKEEMKDIDVALPRDETPAEHSTPRTVRLLVYGGRNYPAGDAYNWLERYATDEVRNTLKCPDASITVLIEGGADGADRGGWEWGRDKHIALMRFPAKWDKHGKSAGPRRNQLMLSQGQPDIAVEFPGGRGTADMAQRLLAARIPIILAEHTREPETRGEANPPPQGSAP